MPVTTMVDKGFKDDCTATPWTTTQIVYICTSSSSTLQCNGVQETNVFTNVGGLVTLRVTSGPANVGHECSLSFSRSYEKPGALRNLNTHFHENVDMSGPYHNPRAGLAGRPDLVYLRRIDDEVNVEMHHRFEEFNQDVVIVLMHNTSRHWFGPSGRTWLNIDWDLIEEVLDGTKQSLGHNFIGF